jgi:hypothetical protein
LTSTNTTNNSNYNQNKIKTSYEKIDSEFQKIEKVTKVFTYINKELNIVRKNNEQLRKNRIKLLESKLQDFCDEVKNIRFSDLLPSQLERAKSDNNISKLFESIYMIIVDSVSINELNNKMNEISSMPSYTITVENNNTISDYENSKNTKLTKLNQNTKVTLAFI